MTLKNLITILLQWISLNTDYDTSKFDFKVSVVNPLELQFMVCGGKCPVVAFFSEEKGIFLSKMDLDDYYKRNSINIADIRLNPYNYLAPRFAADGGLMRTGYQEGGDAEPVAKKTMPLIDMDGKEKDYRETGGFVDMGRMERADDVPARLSKNEFVFTADAVRNAG